MQNYWCPYRERRSGHRRAQRMARWGHGERKAVFAPRRDLGRDQPCQHLDLRPSPPLLGDSECLLESCPVCAAHPGVRSRWAARCRVTSLAALAVGELADSRACERGAVGTLWLLCLSLECGMAPKMSGTRLTASLQDTAALTSALAMILWNVVIALSPVSSWPLESLIPCCYPDLFQSLIG